MDKKTMRAANLYAPGDLRIEEVPVPILGADDVLVKVTACGICGSDIPRVLTKGTYHFPTIPGHEFSGTIIDAGKNVNTSVLGKRVAVIPLIPCRKCKLCEIGQFAQCENYGFLGSRNDGGLAEYVRVPSLNTVPIPDDVSEEAAALLEAVCVALHVVQNLGIKWGDTVAVFGLGAIGNFVSQWAKAFGAKCVFAVDTVKEKVEIAKKVGLKDSICVKDVDVIKLIAESTGGIGVDAVFEASGSQAAFEQAAAVIRISGKLGLVGRPSGEMIISEKTFERILRSQITIRGTWSFEFTTFPHNAWKQSLEALQQGVVLTGPLITHRFPLEMTLNAIRMMAEKKEFIHKILVKP